MSPDTVAIVGAGAIGTALAHALSAAGVPVVAVASRHREHAQALATAIPRAESLSVREAGRAAAIVLLTVSDSAIEDACAALDAAPGVLVAHTSGSRDVTALAAASTTGADVGGIHPLAAVARRAPEADVATTAGTSTFRGALFAIEGNEGVTTRLSALATRTGGHPFPIAADDKPLYHLGASMLAASAAGLSQIAWDQLRIEVARGAGLIAGEPANRLLTALLEDETTGMHEGNP